jgi:hypothetical protein
VLFRSIQKREAQRQSGIQGTQQQAQAAQAGAFGGSRDAIMRAERERNLGTQMGDIQAQGSQAAYTNAQQQFNADQNRGIQGMQLAGSAANTLGQLGGQQFQQGVDINKLQSAYGTQEQALKQQGLSQAYQDFQNQQAYPQQQLGYMANMINGLPVGTEQSVYRTGTPGTPSDLQKLTAVGMGLSSFFAEGGIAEEKSVTDEDNIAEFVRGLNDQQLAKAKQAAQARGDDVQLEVIAKEEGLRASIQRGGLASLPVNMAKMLPTTLSAARGGIVAFADEGMVDEDAPSNSGVYSPGDPVTYKQAVADSAKYIRDISSFKPTPARTQAQREADQQKYYERMQTMGGPDIYADLEKLLTDDRASSADDLKESRRMAIYEAIPAILEGNDFSTAAGKAFGVYGKARSEGNKANKASQRAAAKELLGLKNAKRAEKLGYLKDSQAESAALDKAIREGNKEAIDLILKKAEIGTRLAQATRPQAVRGGGGRPDNSAHRNLTGMLGVSQRLESSIEQEKKNPAYVADMEMLSVEATTDNMKKRQTEAKTRVDAKEKEWNDKRATTQKILEQYQNKAFPELASKPTVDKTTKVPDISSVTGAPKGSKIGKMVAGKGHEVIDASGKLIGYAQ